MLPAHYLPHREVRLGRACPADHLSAHSGALVMAAGDGFRLNKVRELMLSLLLLIVLGVSGMGF